VNVAGMGVSVGAGGRGVCNGAQAVMTTPRHSRQAHLDRMKLRIVAMWNIIFLV
jgi:hypothetical protein